MIHLQSLKSPIIITEGEPGKKTPTKTKPETKPPNPLNSSLKKGLGFVYFCVRVLGW